ncbi:MAG: PaaI family thioesterase [Ardenticatenaceae bacterium]|nr:PaaI family thioesterase [Ardenticatenaceae bacterium]
MATFKQPNSDYCFVCGRKNPRGLYLRFEDNGKNEVYTSFNLSEAYQSYPGVVHGGIVASILDELVARVSMIDDHHHFMMSVKLQIKYRHPVPTGTDLRGVGKIVRLSGRRGIAVGYVYLPDDKIAAEAELTLADVPQEILSRANLEALGWYVDPIP